MRTTQRLDKLLSNYGYGTRREIKTVLKDGAVQVDGKTVKDGSVHVDPNISIIKIHEEVLEYREFIYLMLNKPQDVISATFDNKHKTVLDIIPAEYKMFEPFPVGRLDIDTEGFLLITNDGQLAHELLSPKKHVPKRYYALISGEIGENEVEKFAEGLILEDGYRTLPSKLQILKQGPFSEVEIIIYEGKFHQVKRMFEAVDKKVKYLKRISMGPLLLDEQLLPGQCRELSEEEIKSLKDIHKNEE